jgi:hypothetical protein
MGLTVIPDGWVTDLSLPYGGERRLLGNGAEPQQAIAALRLLVSIAVEDDLGR